MYIMCISNLFGLTITYLSVRGERGERVQTLKGGRGVHVILTVTLCQGMTDYSIEIVKAR